MFVLFCLPWLVAFVTFFGTLDMEALLVAPVGCLLVPAAYTSAKGVRDD